MAAETLFVHDLEFSLTSDHSFIEFNIPFTRDEPTSKMLELSYRDYKSINVSHFCNDVIEILNKDNNFFSLDVETAANFFNEAISLTVEKHAPMKNVKVKKKKNGFTNDDILTMRRQRRKFERRYRKYGMAEDKAEYSKLQQGVAKLVKSTRNAFFEEKLSSFKGNKKETFKVFNEILGHEMEQQLPSFESEVQLCHDFEKFFFDKIHNIRNEVQCDATNTDQTSFLSQQNFSQTHKQFTEFVPLIDSKLTTIINNLSNKHCDLDPMSTLLFKDCLHSLLPFLKYIINSSLETGIFPSCYKKAMVRPNLKNSSLDRDLLNNYRPISNICYFSKVLERCVLDQLSEHLESNNCMGEFQSAYRKHHSCETAITKISNDILCSLDDNECTFLLFLDLSAAFDTVDHKILLSRLLKAHNINGTPLNWFQSYLKNRSYCVKIGKSFSDGIILLFGVPQGSILGPLLFILYIYLK